MSEHIDNIRHRVNLAMTGDNNLESVVQEIYDLQQKLAEREAFKDYVHKRFDEAGAPHSVNWSEHTAAGCRVGGRFDWLRKSLQREAALADHQAKGVEAFSQVVQRQEAEIAELKRKVLQLREASQGNYWAWQGDGEDHLESLTCSVLIDAAKLRELIEKPSASVELEAAEAEIQRLKDLLAETEAVARKEIQIRRDTEERLQTKELFLDAQKRQLEKTLAEATLIKVAAREFMAVIDDRLEPMIRGNNERVNAMWMGHAQDHWEKLVELTDYHDWLKMQKAVQKLREEAWQQEPTNPLILMLQSPDGHPVHHIVRFDERGERIDDLYADDIMGMIVKVEVDQRGYMGDPYPDTPESTQSTLSLMQQNLGSLPPSAYASEEHDGDFSDDFADEEDEE